MGWKYARRALDGFAEFLMKSKFFGKFF